VSLYRWCIFSLWNEEEFCEERGTQSNGNLLYAVCFRQCRRHIMATFVERRRIKTVSNGLINEVQRGNNNIFMQSIFLPTGNCVNCYFKLGWSEGRFLKVAEKFSSYEKLYLFFLFRYVQK
jgi:hypothetical protein